MDIIELVESKRTNNEIPKGMLRKTFGVGELVLFLYLGLFIFFFISIFLTSDEFKLATSKKKNTKAKITELKDEVVNWKYYSYEFITENDTIKEHFSISDKSPLFGLKVNDLIEVEYVISKPNIHRIIALKDDSIFFAFIPIMLIIIVLIIILLILFLKKVKISNKNAKIWKDGIVMTGKLVFVEKENTFLAFSKEMGFKNKAIIEYEIDHKHYRSTTIIKNTWLVSQWKQGETVTIMVDKDDKEKIVAIEEFVY